MSAPDTPDPSPKPDAPAAPEPDAARLKAALASMAQAEDAVARAVRQMSDDAGEPEEPDTPASH